MPTGHAAFLSVSCHEVGSRPATVVSEQFDTIRHDNIVLLPTCYDVDFSSGQAACLGQRFDVILIHPQGNESLLGTYDSLFSTGRSVCLFQCFDVVQAYQQGKECLALAFDSFYSSGKAVALRQTFDVEQPYICGMESWACLLESFYSSGKAVALCQTFDVEQPYIYGTESWACLHESFFSSGKAVALRQTFDVEQPYIHGTESWQCTLLADYSSGQSVVLRQTFDVEQPYVCGIESWPGTHETWFSTGQTLCLVQSFDIDQPYLRGVESWTGIHASVGPAQESALALRYDAIRPDRYCGIGNIYSTWGQSTTEVASHYDIGTPGLSFKIVSVDGWYDSLMDHCVDVPFQLDSVQYDKYWTTVSAMDQQCYQHGILYADVSIVLDSFSDKPRIVGCPSRFSAVEYSQAAVIGLFQCPEMAASCLAGIYGIRQAQEQLVRLQEEALYEYSATLINVVTSFEVGHRSEQEMEVVTPLRDHCTDDGLWQLELATAVRYYNGSATLKEPVIWRFLTKNGKHWKQGPEISEMKVEALESFFQLQFSARWPYHSIAVLIDVYQLETPQEGDFFDLGVWVSDSVWIDTETPPILTIPWSRDIRNYAVHVPRTPTTKFIAVAPIRRFPYEEIGTLAEIFVP